jgi:predicted PurR-regulated permease PerM
MIEAQKELRWIRILLTIIAVPVVVMILKTLKFIFIPLVFAVFLSFVFAPLTGFLRKKRFPSWLIMVSLIVLIIIIFIGISFLLTAAINNLMNGFPNYQQRFLSITQDIVWNLENLIAKMDITLGKIPGLDFSQLLSQESFSISKTISGIMTTTLGIGWNFFLIVVFFLFLVAQGGQMHHRFKQVLDDSRRTQTATTILNIQQKIQKYLLTKTVISLLTAIVGMILMMLFGVDFVLICGILLFVMNYIPNIGSVIASAIPIIICLLQSGFGIRFVSFSLLIIATQMLFGNVIEPKIQGNRLNLSPIMVLVSLIFWGWVWGIVGMLLGVPITSAINIILLQLDEKNLISAIISGHTAEV